MRDTEAVENKK